MIAPTLFASERAIEARGDQLRVALPLTAWAITLLEDDSEGRMQLTQSLLTSSGVTLALKATIDKERPNGEEHSFPSGHTAIAFSGAAFLQRRYGLAYGVPAYAAACYVGWSRIKTDQHWQEDVYAAALLAIVINHYLVEPQQQGGMRVGLSLQANDATIQMSQRW